MLVEAVDMDVGMTSPENGAAALDALFAICERRGASDIHLGGGQVPRLRVQGELLPVENGAPLSAAECDAIAYGLVATTLPSDADGTSWREAREALSAKGAIDGATTSPGGHRYRFNVFLENARTAVALRRLDDRFLSLEELGLPPQLADFCAMPDGLVIVTGPTGSGKSTTLATLVDMINGERRGHIVTIEDPIEYVHESRSCLVRQRQVGRDARSFNAALVEALRQDPDVILVGEIREIDTIRTAITAAETGHLVFATLHAGDCAGAIERLVAVFPAGEQDGIRKQLSMVLRGVFAQHLLPPARRGDRRVACGELLFVNTAVANLVATGRSAQIYSAIENGRKLGMRTLDQELAELCRAGRITAETALAMSRNPEILRGWIGA